MGAPYSVYIVGTDTFGNAILEPDSYDWVAVFESSPFLPKERYAVSRYTGVGGGWLADACIDNKCWYYNDWFQPVRNCFFF